MMYGYGSDIVNQSIARTLIQSPINDNYFMKCVNQRLYDGGMGSYYSEDVDYYKLSEALITSYWREISHPNVDKPCRCFVCHDFLEGYVGVIDIELLEDDVELYLEDYKGTGKLSLCVKVNDSINESTKTKETYLIIGNDGDGDILFTFHPGEPLKPSTLNSDGCNEYGVKCKDILTKKEALKMGFRHAKIVRE